MANVDRTLSKLLNIYQHSEEDCIGGYSEFSECDKKCGITYKSKTYVVENQGGILGSDCIENDGRRKKTLCDKSDGVYPCIVGESCQEDGDCKTNNCDPKTDKCVEERVCSPTNLDLCNKEDCLNLKNNNDYAEREFKFDEAEPGIKCKLEKKENNNDNNNDNNNNIVGEDIEEIDLYSLSAAQCDNNPDYWYLTSGDSGDYADQSISSAVCRLKIPESVYYQDGSPELKERRLIYGDAAMTAGLYCEIGLKFSAAGVNSDKGVTDPIKSIDLEGVDKVEDLCQSSIDDGVDCPPESWPPLKYFTDKTNLRTTEAVGIIDLCKRCANGYGWEGECKKCPYEINKKQYFSSSKGIRSAGGESAIGLAACSEAVEDPGVLTCKSMRAAGFACPTSKVPIGDNSDQQTAGFENFGSMCCKKCLRGFVHACFPLLLRVGWYEMRCANALRSPKVWGALRSWHCVFARDVRGWYTLGWLR